MLEFLLREFLGIPVWLWIIGWLGIAIILNQISQTLAMIWVFFPWIVLMMIIYSLQWFVFFYEAVRYNRPMREITVDILFWGDKE